MRGTQSVGVTLLFWLAGALYTVAGAHLNIEFGLSTPRHRFQGEEQGIPRSGGTLNYVSLPSFLCKIEEHFLTPYSYNMCLFGLPTATEPFFL
jgi:hypothetical protein